MFSVQTTSTDSSYVIDILKHLNGTENETISSNVSITQRVSSGTSVTLGSISVEVNGSNQIVVQGPFTVNGFSQTFAGASPVTNYWTSLVLTSGQIMSGNMGSSVGNGATILFSDVAGSSTWQVSVQKAMINLWSITIRKL